MRSSIVFITHIGCSRMGSDIPLFCVGRKTKVVQTWHGIPLKKIGLDDLIFRNSRLDNKVLRNFIINNFLPFIRRVRDVDLVLALSQETKEIFSSAFATKIENVKITGYPRNDNLISSKLNTNDTFKVIYMPTFRNKIGDSSNILYDSGFDINQIDKKLQEHNIFLDIKLHPFNTPTEKMLKDIKLAANIDFVSTNNIYDVIADYNVLITDYSSIYFDYLLLDRPIVFYPFDKESYLKKDREMYFEYDDVTPGFKANSWLGIANYIVSIKDDTKNDTFLMERKIIRDRFHYYQDNQSCKRAFDASLDLLTHE